MVTSDACFVMHASELEATKPSKSYPQSGRGIIRPLAEKRRGFPQRFALVPGDFLPSLWDFPTQKRVAPWDFLTKLLTESH
jgi:hypothetical protein